MPQPRRRLRALALTPFITAALVVGGLAPAASAVTAPEPWSISGIGAATLLSDGVGAPAQFSYDAAGSFNGTWSFRSTAAVTGTVTVPYVWTGHHSWYNARASLSVFDDEGSAVLVNQYASDGFSFSGLHTFTLTAGETYGFNVGGSHADSSRILRGTFTLGNLEGISFPTRDISLGSPATVDVTASSGLTPDLTSSTPSVCTVTGLEVTPVSVGICTLIAATAGNANYPPGSATQSFAVVKRADAITFAAPAGVTMTSDVVLAATAASGLPVAYQSLTPGTCVVVGTALSPLAAGACTVEATTAGDSTHLPAATTASLTIALAGDTIATPATREAEVGERFTLASTTAGGVAVTHSSLTPSVCTVASATVMFRGAGECRISAESAGDTTFDAATAALVFSVAAAPAVAEPADPAVPAQPAQLPVMGVETSGWAAAIALLLAAGLGLLGLQRAVRRRSTSA